RRRADARRLYLADERREPAAEREVRVLEPYEIRNPKRLRIETLVEDLRRGRKLQRAAGRPLDQTLNPRNLVQEHAVRVAERKGDGLQLEAAVHLVVQHARIDRRVGVRERRLHREQPVERAPRL